MRSRTIACSKNIHRTASEGKYLSHEFGDSLLIEAVSDEFVSCRPASTPTMRQLRREKAYESDRHGG